MFSFSLPSPASASAPASTNTSVTTAWQSHHSSIMTSPASFSSGNWFYHPAYVQDEPYIHQWHSGGAERVPPHLYDATKGADVEVSGTTIRKRRSAQGIAAYHPYKLYKKLTQSESDSIQARLGKEPDASIAADFGVSHTRISRRRSAQGIAPYLPHKAHEKLTQSQLDSIQARLGKEPDASIAADFGVSQNTIQSRRRAQGIAACKPHKCHKLLTQSQLDSIQARLGKESDASIAADFGVSQSSIQRRRSAQGIAVYRPSKLHEKLTQSESDNIQARLGKESDASIAADFGVSHTMISRLRSAQGIAPYHPPKAHEKLTQSQSESIKARLGKEPDASIAADFGVSRGTIRNRRSAQGIAAYKPLKPYEVLTQSQLESIKARLGKEPDASIAVDFGLSQSTIQSRRNAQGIAAFQPRKLYLK